MILDYLFKLIFIFNSECNSWFLIVSLLFVLSFLNHTFFANAFSLNAFTSLYCQSICSTLILSCQQFNYHVNPMILDYFFKLISIFYSECNSWFLIVSLLFVLSFLNHTFFANAFSSNAFTSLSCKSIWSTLILSSQLFN